MNQDTLINQLLKIIQNYEGYTDNEIQMFKRIKVEEDKKNPIPTYFVRLEVGEIEVDFICFDIFSSNPKVQETNFDEWPIPSLK